jgi:hypothetical protein
MRTVLRLHVAGGLALALLGAAPPSAAVAQSVAAPAAPRRLRVTWDNDTDRRTAIGRGWRDGDTIGALAGNSSYTSCHRDGANCFFVSDRRLNELLVGAAVYGIPSAVLGTGFGALTRRDVWRDSTVLVRPRH